MEFKVSYNIRWIFHWFSGSSILVFRSSEFGFAHLACHKLTNLNLVPCVILLMTVLKLTATPGIVTTTIGSKPDTNAGFPWRCVVCISNRQWGTEFNLWSAYQSVSSQTMPGKMLCANVTYSSRVFPHKMHSGHPITTFTVTNLQSIAAATYVKVFSRPISSATSAPAISASETHLFTMKQMAQTGCARNLVAGRPGIEYLWPGIRSSVDWQIGWALRSLTASSRHSGSNALLIVLRTVFNTELVFAGSRSSAPRVNNRSGLSLRVRVWVQTEPLPS